MACRRKYTRRAIEPECNEIVCVLIGYQHEFAGRVDHKVPGSFPLHIRMSGTRKQAVGLIDGIDHDTAVSTIRAEEESARRIDLCLCTGACPCEALWER